MSIYRSFGYQKIIILIKIINRLNVGGLAQIIIEVSISKIIYTLNLKCLKYLRFPEHLEDLSINVFILYFNNPQAVVNITWTANFLFSTKFEFDSIFPRKASQYGHCIRRILTHTCSIKLNMTGLNGVSHSYTLHTALTTIK